MGSEMCIRDSLNILNNLFLGRRNTFPKFFHMPMVVPSARVGQLAAEFGFEQVKLAQGADTESMVSAICEVAPEVYKRDGK